jgi:drug/metabolite transporter (DMT)-like permease
MGTWGAFAYIIVFGTVISFSIFLYSLTLIGAQTASLLCSVEPLAATLAAVWWLNVSFLAMDWLGTTLIVLTIIVLTYASKKENKSEPAKANRNFHK